MGLIQIRSLRMDLILSYIATYWDGRSITLFFKHDISIFLYPFCVRFFSRESTSQFPVETGYLTLIPTPTSFPSVSFFFSSTQSVMQTHQRRKPPPAAVQVASKQAAPRRTLGPLSFTDALLSLLRQHRGRQHHAELLPLA